MAFHCILFSRIIVKTRLPLVLFVQIKEIHDLFDSASSPTFSEPEEDLSSPQSTSYSEPHSHFLFGNSVLVDSLLSYHPSPSSSHILLTVFEENIAPINSIIHKPSLRNLIQTACVTPELLDRGSEALVFSVYFAATSSMTSEQCIARLGEDRAALVKHYRFAVEQALARAGLLHTHKFIVLQAAVLFLTCACHPKDVQFIWAMIGLVARLGMGLGLHRDGSRFGLSPFETEMRRRLWWYIYLLDVQTSDFQATSPQIREGDYDTRLPLNLNDDDWSLELVEPPQERSGFTEMTLTLVRCKILMTTRKLMQMTSATAGGPTELFQKRALAIEKAKESLHNTHLQYCDVTNPIHWVVATIGRVAISRLWLISHFSLLTAEGFDPNMWPNQCEILVTTAIEVLEFTYLLQTHENTAHWAWLFQGHVQWQSIAFVLSELCARPTFPSSDRAWTVINRIFEKWNHASIYKEGIIMRLLGRLKSRAVAVRDQLHVSDPTLPVESTEWAIPMSEFTPVQQLVLESSNAQTEALDIFRDVWSNIDLNPGDEIWG